MNDSICCNITVRCSHEATLQAGYSGMRLQRCCLALPLVLVHRLDCLHRMPEMVLSKNRPENDL